MIARVVFLAQLAALDMALFAKNVYWQYLIVILYNLPNVPKVLLYYIF